TLLLGIDGPVEEVTPSRAGDNLVRGQIELGDRKHEPDNTGSDPETPQAYSRFTPVGAGRRTGSVEARNVRSREVRKGGLEPPRVLPHRILNRRPWPLAAATAASSLSFGRRATAAGGCSGWVQGTTGHDRARHEWGGADTLRGALHSLHRHPGLQ